MIAVGRRIPVLALSAALAGSSLWAQPPISDARLETALGTRPIEAASRYGSNGEAVWIGWQVEAVPVARDLCCRAERGSARGCSLAEEPRSWGGRDDRADAAPVDLVVLVEHRGGRPGAMRIVSPRCAIDGAGRRVVWLGEVDAAASLALLEPMLAAGGDEDLADDALVAVAHHAGSEADALLERRIFDAGLDRDARQDAIFWTGNLRGERGVRVLDRVLAEEPDGDLREHTLFALTLSELDSAFARLRRAAVEDRDPEVRSQGLFWLAQSEAPDAGAWIFDRIAAEPDADVREQGVFALAQLDDGTDWLIRILRSGEDPELARQALFWLGQSDDPRAMAELERILR